MSPPVKVVNFFESKKSKIGLVRIPVSLTWAAPSTYIHFVDFYE